MVGKLRGAAARIISLVSQGSFYSLYGSYHEVKNVKHVLRECQINVELFHDQIYRRALVIAESIDVQKSSPRLAS